MFRTTYVHHQEDYIIHSSLCVMFFVHVYKQTSRLEDVLDILNINPLTPNDIYISRTAPLTSKRCILCIYSTNVSTEYFKYALYSPFFFSSKCSLFHNANLFGSCIIHILYRVVLKLKKK